MKKTIFVQLKRGLCITLILSTPVIADGTDKRIAGASELRNITIPHPPMMSIGVDLTHLRRSHHETFHLDAPPKVYTQLDVCTTFQSITRCQNIQTVGKTTKDSLNDTNTGYHHDFESGGISAHIDRAKVNLDTMYASSNEIIEARDKNREEILIALRAKLKKAGKKKFDIDQEVTRQDFELRKQIPYLQASIIQLMPGVGLFGSDWGKPAGCMVMPLDMMAERTDSNVPLNVVTRDNEDKRKCYTVKVDGEYYDKDPKDENANGWSSGMAWGTWNFQPSSLTKDELIASNTKTENPEASDKTMRPVLLEGTEPTQRAERSESLEDPLRKILGLTNPSVQAARDPLEKPEISDNLSKDIENEEVAQAGSSNEGAAIAN